MLQKVIIYGYNFAVCGLISKNQVLLKAEDLSYLYCIVLYCINGGGLISLKREETPTASPFEPLCLPVDSHKLLSTLLCRIYWQGPGESQWMPRERS